MRRSSTILELLHSNLCGPVAFGTDEKFILTITDDYSRFTWVLFLTEKGDTFEVFRNFVTMIEKEFSTIVGCVLGDHQRISLDSDRAGYWLIMSRNWVRRCGHCQSW